MSCIYYQTPRDWAFLAGILSRVSFSLDYLGVIPNEMILSDYYYYQGTKYLRSWDQNTNLRLRKDVSLASDALNLGIYLEVRNLFDDKWLNLGVFEGNITPEDEQKMVESDFQYPPPLTRI